MSRAGRAFKIVEPRDDGIAQTGGRVGVRLRPGPALKRIDPAEVGEITALHHNSSSESRRPAPQNVAHHRVFGTQSKLAHHRVRRRLGDRARR